MELSKLGQEEIQICNVVKGKVEVKPKFQHYTKFFNQTDPVDLITIISECVTHIQPAWYISPEFETPDVVDVALVSSGTITRKEALSQAYRENADEDLKIADEFSWTRLTILERDGEEG